MDLQDGELIANAIQMNTAPCRYCGYNGSGYYQPRTHKFHCKWYHIGGMVERMEITKVQLTMQQTELIVSGEQAIIQGIVHIDPHMPVISIVSPCTSHPKIMINRPRTLRLQFHDISPYGIEEKHLEPYRDGLMQTYHAELILDFIEAITTECQAQAISFPKKVYIHCEAGVSRSPAVAMALSMIYGFRPTVNELFHTHNAYNEYVLCTVLNTWRNRSATNAIKNMREGDTIF